MIMNRYNSKRGVFQSAALTSRTLQYQCDNGLLEVVLSTNATLRCLYEGQKVYVRIMDQEGWLHSSHIICPACEDMCPSDKCNSSPEEDADNTIDESEPPNQSFKCTASLVVPVTWTIATLSLLAVAIPLI